MVQAGQKGIGSRHCGRSRQSFSVGSGFWLGWSAGRKCPENIAVTGVTDIAAPSSTGIYRRRFQHVSGRHGSSSTTTISVTPALQTRKRYTARSTGWWTRSAIRIRNFLRRTVTSNSSRISPATSAVSAPNLAPTRTGNIVIVAPLKGTPAEAAGLKPKDLGRRHQWHFHRGHDGGRGGEI